MRRVPLILLLSTAPLCAAPYQPPKPSENIREMKLERRDAARDRDVPVKIYYPATGSGPWPVILFSHGLGGSREGYAYLGRYWAGCGYVSVHLQHAGSDDSIWLGKTNPRESAMQAVANPRVAVERARDVPFALSELETLNAHSPLAGKLDLAHIGFAGHSFGGWSAMVVAGQSLPLAGTSLAQPRVKAVVEMSAPVPQRLAAAKLADISTPVFHVTGTRDDSPLGDTKASQRRALYDGMTAPGACLLVFDGADHMVFSGVRRGGTDDPKIQRLTCEGTTAYWDAWLRDDAAARAWLYGGGFAHRLGGAGVFKTK